MRRAVSGRDRTSVLFMGWIERYKGIFDLVDAVDRFRKELASTRFVICGRGSEIAVLHERISDLGLTSQFEFRGWVSGLDKFAAFREAGHEGRRLVREGFGRACH